MLVLTRKIGESIVIGGGITVQVLSMDGARCRIGIDAPLDVTVDREEVYERKARTGQVMNYAGRGTNEPWLVRS